MMEKKSLPLSKVYQLMEPGPVVMITTAWRGKANIMTLSWHMMVEFEPPLIALVMSDQNYSFAALQKSNECVINIPTVDLAKKVVGVGNCTGAKIDKFTQFDLSTDPASIVRAPLIRECYANLECIVINTTLAKKYNIFIVEVVKAWITRSKKRIYTIHHCGNGRFIVDGKLIQLPSKKK